MSPDEKGGYRQERFLKVLRFGRDVLACITSAASDGYRFEGSVVLELAC